MLSDDLRKIDTKTAVDYIEQYFSLLPSGRPQYTGSRFETFVGGGDKNDPNRITSDDLIAVSMLAVHVPAQAALGIVEDLSDKLTGLLSQLPVDLRLSDLSDGGFERLLNRDDSPADRLWKCLRSHADKWGVGQTTASKIMARNRPDLIPIFDSVIQKRLGLPDSGGYWRLWHEAFTGAGKETLIKRLQDIREQSGQHHLSLLRTLDIVFWMDSHGAAKIGVAPVTETVDTKD